jgi:hypothetical protein
MLVTSTDAKMAGLAGALIPNPARHIPQFLNVREMILLNRRPADEVAHHSFALWYPRELCSSYAVVISLDLHWPRKGS